MKQYNWFHIPWRRGRVGNEYAFTLKERNRVSDEHSPTLYLVCKNMYCQSGNMSVTYGVLKTGHGWLAALQEDNYLLIKIWIWYWNYISQWIYIIKVEWI